MVYLAIINGALPSAGNINNYHCIHENEILKDYFLFCFYIALTGFRENIVGTFYVFYNKIKNIISLGLKTFFAQNDKTHTLTYTETFI